MSKKPSEKREEAGNVSGDNAYSPNSQAATDARIAEARRKVEAAYPGITQKFGITTVSKVEHDDEPIPPVQPLIYREVDLLWAILHGVKGGEGEFLVPKCKLSILVDGETLKIAVQDASQCRTAYKALDEDKTLPGAIQEALAGDLQWNPWNNGSKKK